ncbi:uncharacterized protein BJ171DRAFT_600460 [Polychytrium aggregatum]|uniref:uncharacterized protein n=1 Tax=Polychytrium aggregatum TaxID=110093 RepID=UPI0022FF39BC|nr:uncharacterized protein BJ171DRAFT_600460 [Polychytrium aggregatum]KAI9203016.1 hypothetical protein BJ171DRAFT_600460 [Polychytrium aggregatum]
MVLNNNVPTPEQVEADWKVLDFNGNGILSLAEIDKYFVERYPNSFGQDKPALMRAYKGADKSKDGFIEKDEFHELVRLLFYYDQIYQIFVKLDTNHDHRIDFKEFAAGHSRLGLPDADSAAIRREFDAIDENHGGYILFKEFCHFMAKKAKDHFHP